MAVPVKISVALLSPPQETAKLYLKSPRNHADERTTNCDCRLSAAPVASLKFLWLLLSHARETTAAAVAAAAATSTTETARSIWPQQHLRQFSAPAFELDQHNQPQKLRSFTCLVTRNYHCWHTVLACTGPM